MQNNKKKGINQYNYSRFRAFWAWVEWAYETPKPDGRGRYKHHCQVKRTWPVANIMQEVKSDKEF